MPDRVIVIGGGGHAKVVLSTLLLRGYSIAGVYDDDRNKWGQGILGQPIIGDLEQAKNADVEFAIAAIGSNEIRKSVVSRLEKKWLTLIHPASVIDSSAVIGDGTFVGAGAIIQADSVIGKHCIVNTSASVDHDVCLADFTHICPGAHITGNVTIGAGVMVGAGAVVIPGVEIGEFAVVGAGAAVVRDVPARATVYGVPAKLKK